MHLIGSSRLSILRRKMKDPSPLAWPCSMTLIRFSKSSKVTWILCWVVVKVCCAFRSSSRSSSWWAKFSSILHIWIPSAIVTNNSCGNSGTDTNSYEFNLKFNRTLAKLGKNQYLWNNFCLCEIETNNVTTNWDKLKKWN